MVFNYFKIIISNTPPPISKSVLGLLPIFPTPPSMPTPAPAAALESLNAFPSTGIEVKMLLASAIPDKAESVLPMFVYLY